MTNSYSIESDSEVAKLVFPNGSYIKVHYKRMTDKQIIFIYDFECMRGVMKVTPGLLPTFDDIIGQAECGMPELFLPLLLDYFKSVQQSRLSEAEIANSMLDQGDLDGLRNRNWLKYHDLSPKAVKVIRRELVLLQKIMSEIAA